MEKKIIIKVYQKKQDFLAAWREVLREDEIKNNLMLGLLEQETVIPDYLVSIRLFSEWLLGVIAGKNMILAANSINHILYQHLITATNTIEYPGIIGPKKVCERFNEAYCLKYDQSLVKVMDQRIYACTKINHVSQDVGSVRVATENDFAVLSPWVYDFTMMVEGETNLEAVNNNLRRKIASGQLYVLDVNGKIVSMAQRARPLTHSETVSLVYTPLDMRGQGYATHIVEVVTEGIIKEGKAATLYTDLSNPTSNRIYINIGYKPYCDSSVYLKQTF